MTEDHLPPHSLEAEAAVLGCIMREFSGYRDGEQIEPSHCLRDVLEFIESPDCFYDQRHRVIFSTMLRLDDQKKPIHEIAIYLELQRTGSVQAAGGHPYLLGLPDFCPAPVMAGHFAQEVLRFHLARRLIESSYSVADDATREEIEDVAARAQKQAQEIIEAAKTKKKGRTIKELVQECIDKMDSALGQDERNIGMPTGFHDVDRMTGGLVPKEMFVIAARPAIGKTALLANIVHHLAVLDTKRVLFFSLEGGDMPIANRLIHIHSQTSMTDSRYGRLNNGQMASIGVAVKMVADSKIEIIDHEFTLQGIETLIAKRYQTTGVDLVCIDYLQLVRPRTTRRDNRQNEVAEISMAIKGMALEFGVPFLVLAQLNRELEKNSRPPRLTDLRESGQIEQDADVVLFLWREEDSNDWPKTVSAKIAKNRNGECGEFRFVFFPDQSRFESASKI